MSGRTAIPRSVLAALVAGLLAAPAQAQPGPDRPKEAPPARERAPSADAGRAEQLQQAAFAALGKGDLAGAEKALREQIALDPDNFVPYYNLACAKALAREDAAAIDLLAQAIDRGFVDRAEMERDDSLARLRGTPAYRDLVADWTGTLARHRDANVERSRALIKRKVAPVTDEPLRLVYLSAFPEHSFAAAREEVTRLARWADAKVFPGILDPAQNAEDSWVVVVLPAREDFSRWAVAQFGPDVLKGLSTVGGSYSHDDKRLVAQDLGPTLRHEFFHVLHWRSCARLKQRHPAWIQEGLCSLVEDYDLTPDGSLAPTPSWRTNTVKRMDQAGLLFPLRKLAGKTRQDFQGERRMGLYAQSRGVFLYLYQQGRLAEWYAAYTQGFAQDSTGVNAIEQVLGATPEQFDKDFRAWVRALPTIPEEMRPGMPLLGVEVDAGEGEGPVVRSFQRGSPPGQERLSPGDVILSINSQPTRDLPELLRRMGALRPGQTVPVTFRRVKLIKSIDVKLGEFRGP